MNVIVLRTLNFDCEDVEVTSRRNASCHDWVCTRIDDVGTRDLFVYSFIHIFCSSSETLFRDLFM